MIKIKVCGLSDPGNIREIAGLNPDFMGFIFYRGSKRCIGRDSAVAVRRSCKGILKAGVFVNEELPALLGLADVFDLNIIQLHGDEDPEFCERLKSEGYLVIKSFRVADSFCDDLCIPYLNVCDYFLFDTLSVSYGGSGKKFNWDLLRNYRLNTPFFLSGGIGPENAGEIRILDHTALYAADINSRFELRPGIKDPYKIKVFIDQIKNGQQ